MSESRYRSSNRSPDCWIGVAAASATASSVGAEAASNQLRGSLSFVSCVPGPICIVCYAHPWAGDNNEPNDQGQQCGQGIGYSWDMVLGRHSIRRWLVAQVCQSPGGEGVSNGAYPFPGLDVGEVQGRLGRGGEHLEDAVPVQYFQCAGRPFAGLQLDIAGHSGCDDRRWGLGRGRARGLRCLLSRLSAYGIRSVYLVGREGRTVWQLVRPVRAGAPAESVVVRQHARGQLVGPNPSANLDGRASCRRPLQGSRRDRLASGRRCGARLGRGLSELKEPADLFAS